MDESTQTLLIPCRYHRFCNGYLNPAHPLQGDLCPDCFESIDDGYEQVEQEERTDHLAAEEQRDAELG